MSELSAYNEFFSKAQHKKVYIDVDSTPSVNFLANEYLINESISLEEALYSDENIRFGACESSCLRLTISKAVNIDFQDKWIEVSFSIEGDDSSTIVTSLGKYKVISAKPTKDRLYQDLTCYDKMYDILNANVATWYQELTFPMTMKNFRDSFFTAVNVTQVATNLINDSFVIQGGFITSEELSGKTIVEAICELNGVFGHITKDNKFEYVSIPGSETVPLAYYQNGTCVYEDYVTDAFTGVIAYSEDGNVGEQVGTNVNPYMIQNNYLIWGSEGTQNLEDALTNLLTKITNIQFKPFTVRTYGNPMLPLGTPITMTSHNGSISSVVMRKYMFGIQNLRDELSAVGDKKYPNDINSTKKEIVRNKGIVHKMENVVDKLNSEIYDTSTGILTQIQQTNSEVVLKVNNSHNMVRARLGTDPDDQTAMRFQVDANNMNLTASNIINILAGNILNLTSNNIQIQSTNFSVTKDGDVTMRNFDASGAMNVTQGGTIGSYSVDSNGNLVANYGGYEVTISTNAIQFQNTTTGKLVRFAYNGIFVGDSQSTTQILNDTRNISSNVVNAALMNIVEGNNTYEVLSRKKVHTGMVEGTFHEGVCHLPFSSFGVSSRPSSLALTACSGGAIVLNYMYADSISDVCIWGSDSSSWSIEGGGWLEGVTVKISYVCIES